MTTSSSTLSRRLSRSARVAAIALVAGAGVALSPLPASASAPAGPPVQAVQQAAVAPNHAAQVVVDTAMAQRGKPYVWGAAGPNSFDCSGLTQTAFGAAGIRLPHSSRIQSTMGVPVGVWDLKPGDLLFFYSPVSHVGIYIGNGLMVHASTAGQPVSVVSAASMPHFAGARRIV
jgi:cell wall-associated NlpC family hydrolase